MLWVKEIVSIVKVRKQYTSHNSVSLSQFTATPTLMTIVSSNLVFYSMKLM